MKLSGSRLLALLLSAFFLLGAAMNLLGPRAIGDDFAAWGYPVWFRYVTGVLELATAALLPAARSRLAGIGLGAAVMVSALATLIIHAEWLHAAAPAVVLAALFGLWRLSIARR